MIHGVHHIGLQSPAPQQALAPYLQTAAQGLTEWGSSTLARAPNCYLVARRGPAPQRQASVHALGIAHVCLQTRDGARVRGQLEASGVRLIAEPASLGTGFHYAYAHDREGRLIELESAPFVAATPTSWVAHVAYVSADIERLAGFYSALTGRPCTPGSRVVGVAAADRIAGLQGVDVQPIWIRGMNLTLEFWRYHAPALPVQGERQCGYTHVAFQVDDVAAAQQHAESLGAQRVAHRAFDVPCAGQASVLDPDGNLILFIALGADHDALSLQALDHLNVLDHVPAARQAYLAARAAA